MHLSGDLLPVPVPTNEGTIEGVAEIFDMVEGDAIKSIAALMANPQDFVPFHQNACFTRGDTSFARRFLQARLKRHA